MTIIGRNFDLTSAFTPVVGIWQNSLLFPGYATTEEACNDGKCF
jgi:hypothetical protein